ncbi:MAG: hypothetical protein LBU55_01780 [Elusimicrobiota bacterium]|nr:hypothetical protein [Elusimicrobiota bacterium]
MAFNKRTRQRRQSHFVTTHYMDEAEYSNNIAFMRSGRIAALGSVQV